MADTGNDIIIKGGSVRIDFPEDYSPEGNSGRKKFKNDKRRIVQIRIVDQNNIEKYNSGPEDPNGLKWTITVSNDVES